MKFSFYRNVTWVIGILVAVEVCLKMGVKKGLFLLIADLLVVLILTYLFHRLNVTGSGMPADDQSTPGTAVEDSRAESKWQKEHDQWWQRHQQLRATGNVDHTKAPTKPHSSGSDNLNQLEHSNHELKARINYLNRKITLLQNDQNKNSDDSVENSGWYRQVIKMKHQIAKLKSEYK